MQGHLGHINDKADQCYGLVTESHLVSHCQAVAPESRPEMLLELPEPLMGLSRAPHLAAVVPFPCARCLEQDWCPDGLHQVKVCTTVPAHRGKGWEGRRSGGARSWLCHQDFLLMSARWVGPECLSVPSVSPESTYHSRDFKNPLVFIPLKVLGCSPRYLTSCVSKQSAIQALAVLQLVLHLM